MHTSAKPATTLTAINQVAPPRRVTIGEIRVITVVDRIPNPKACFPPNFSDNKPAGK